VPEGEVTEAAGEANLGLVVEALVPKKPHPVLDERPTNLFHGLGAEIGSGVDPSYLGSDPSGQALDGELH
jgi:hypothetical protein